MLMQATRLATLALAVLLGASASNAQSITTVVANNGGGGVFLNLTPAGGALSFTGFRTYMRSNTVGTPGNIEVWTRPGTYVGFTTNSAGWTLTQTLTANSNGRTTLTALIPLTTPILLPAGTTTAVYLQGVTVGNNIHFNGTSTIPAATSTFSNADITLFSDKIYLGNVTTSFTGTLSTTPVCFAGVIEYTPANVAAQGACCTPTAVCTVQTAANCVATGISTFSGDNTTCNPNLCTHRGACCSTLTNACTLSPNGAAGCGADTTYQGDASTCIPNICPGGACCNPITGVCSLTAPTGCPSGSSYQSNGTTCSPNNPCPQPPPPANDDCTSAQPLSLNVAVLATNAQATGDGTEGPGGSCYLLSPAHFNKAIWYSFTAPATTTYLVSVCGATFDTVMSVFSSSGPTPCDALVEIGCDDDTCIGGTDNPLPGPGSSNLASLLPSIAMNSGETYYIRPASWSTSNGAFGIVVQYSEGVTVGSCCVSGVCTLTDSGNCAGTYTDGATCTPTACPTPGVCCRGSTCSTAFTSAAACEGATTTSSTGGPGWAFVSTANPCNAGVMADGNYSGALTSVTSPCCFANYNHNSGLEVQDIFDFLNDWFAGRPIAIPGGDGTSLDGLAVQNIFNFLNAWFAGGCS